MQPHQQRVLDEAKELEVKLEALSEFISSSDVYSKLQNEEKGRLVKQSRAMGEYLSILHERISAF